MQPRENREAGRSVLRLGGRWESWGSGLQLERPPLPSQHRFLLGSGRSDPPCRWRCVANNFLKTSKVSSF